MFCLEVHAKSKPKPKANQKPNPKANPQRRRRSRLLRLRSLLVKEDALTSCKTALSWVKNFLMLTSHTLIT